MKEKGKTSQNLAEIIARTGENLALPPGLDHVSEYTTPEDPTKECFYHCELAACCNEQGNAAQMYRHVTSYAHKHAWILAGTGKKLLRKTEIDAYLATHRRGWLTEPYRSVCDETAWAMCRKAKLRATVEKSGKGKREKKRKKSATRPVESSGGLRTESLLSQLSLGSKELPVPQEPSTTSKKTAEDHHQSRNDDEENSSPAQQTIPHISESRISNSDAEDKNEKEGAKIVANDDNSGPMQCDDSPSTNPPLELSPERISRDEVYRTGKQSAVQYLSSQNTLGDDTMASSAVSPVEPGKLFESNSGDNEELDESHSTFDCKPSDTTDTVESVSGDITLEADSLEDKTMEVDNDDNDNGAAITEDPTQVGDESCDMFESLSSEFPPEKANAFTDKEIDADKDVDVNDAVSTEDHNKDGDESSVKESAGNCKETTVVESPPSQPSPETDNQELPTDTNTLQSEIANGPCPGSTSPAIQSKKGVKRLTLREYMQKKRMLKNAGEGCERGQVDSPSGTYSRSNSREESERLQIGEESVLSRREEESMLSNRGEEVVCQSVVMESESIHSGQEFVRSNSDPNHSLRGKSVEKEKDTLPPDPGRRRWLSEGQPAGGEGQPAGGEGQPAGGEGQPAGGEGLPVGEGKPYLKKEQKLKRISIDLLHPGGESTVDNFQSEEKPNEEMSQIKKLEFFHAKVAKCVNTILHNIYYKNADESRNRIKSQDDFTKINSSLSRRLREDIKESVELQDGSLEFIHKVDPMQYPIEVEIEKYFYRLDEVQRKFEASLDTAIPGGWSF